MAIDIEKVVAEADRLQEFIHEDYGRVSTLVCNLIAAIEQLQAGCRELEMAEASAMALVLAHEGRIEQLQAENAKLIEVGKAIVFAWRGDNTTRSMHQLKTNLCVNFSLCPRYYTTRS